MTGGTLERRARPEGNDNEGRRPVVVVSSSRFGKVAEARAVVGVASTEREGNQ
jgi:mRNA-degrading endonuclease toxin of MazEF toxin-antitoxin module